MTGCGRRVSILSAISSFVQSVALIQAAIVGVPFAALDFKLRHYRFSHPIDLQNAIFHTSLMPNDATLADAPDPAVLRAPFHA